MSVTTPAAPAPPPAPGAPQLSAVSSTSVQLGWTAVSGATEYEVRRDGQAVTTTSSTSYLDTGLSPETSYSYRLVAKNGSGSSPARSRGLGHDPGGTGRPAAGAHAAWRPRA